MDVTAKKEYSFYNLGVKF